MGRLVFTSGEILTAANMNELSDQSVMVFADSSARSSAIPSPSEGMVTYVEDANRVEVYDGSSFGPIGGILQVVSTTKTDTFSTNSNSFTDVTGLSATITPSSTASKVLIVANVSASPPTGNGEAYHIRVAGGNAGSFVGAAAGSRVQSVYTVKNFSSVFLASGSMLAHPVSFLDSPNTTSAITYKIQASVSNTFAMFVNRSSDDPDNATSGRGASAITLMEVAV